MSRQSGQLLTIGAFSKRSRLSLKALRLYGDIGLLEPVVVDEHTGYRYYDEDQLEAARLIGLLRRLEMPLAQIREVISLDGAVAVKSIGGYWQGVEVDLRTKRKLVRYLTAYLSGKGLQMFEVETREVPERLLATVERHVLVGDLPTFIEESAGSLMTLLAAAGATTGNLLVMYHGEVNTDSDGPVEVCLPYEGEVQPAGEMRLRSEPAHKEAFTRITKGQVSFPGILEAFGAVEKWIVDTGGEMSASPREVYFADWNNVGDDDPACDVAFPIRS